jgi:hypothetical protein
MKCAKSDCDEFSERLWDKEGRRVSNPGTFGKDGSLISLQASNFPLFPMGRKSRLDQGVAIVLLARNTKITLHGWSWW